jgi:hypothetical protein
MNKTRNANFDREPKLHKVQKGMGSRIDKHKKLIYNLASSYKSGEVDVDDEFDANLYYDTHNKRR